MSTYLVKVTINGQEHEVPKGARLIDVCRDKGFDIPSFCYYADLALQASCRMCLGRIEKKPKLQTSCTITVTDGMVVTTQSEEIEKAQRGMTEFLLANHPLDCPVCDRGGECELQEMSLGSRGGELMRVVARDRYVNGINGEFLCVKGRFGHPFVNHEARIRTPMIRYKKGGKLIPATWDEAIRHVAERLDAIANESGRNAIGVIGSPRLTNEALHVLHKFAT